MTLSDSALCELLDAIGVGDGTDLVRELAQRALQLLIEAEAAEKIGAGRYERSDARGTHRNGSRPKTLSTNAGDLVAAMGVEAGISKSEVSRICAGLNE